MWVFVCAAVVVWVPVLCSVCDETVKNPRKKKKVRCVENVKAV